MLKDQPYSIKERGFNTAVLRRVREAATAGCNGMRRKVVTRYKSMRWYALVSATIRSGGEAEQASGADGVNPCPAVFDIRWPSLFCGISQK